MSKFFFDYRSNADLTRDQEGLEFPDFETAYREALKAAVDLWIEAVRELRYPGADALEIRDASDRVLRVVPLTSIFLPDGTYNQSVGDTGRASPVLHARLK